MDINRFEHAFNRVVNCQKRSAGIGTLGEKTLHAVLKHYFEPNELNHEIKLGTHYADILNCDGITEIQTRQWNKLRGKLKAFLPENIVTLVYPVAFTKWLLWLDQETGEVSKRRLSPKKGSAYEIFPELYKIKSFLKDDNLRLCIVYVDIEEYRLLNGWSTDRKRGSWRHDRIPKALQKTVYINNFRDYVYLIPENLPQHFTSKEFSKTSGLSISSAQTALNILYHVGAVERIGKTGNTFIYERRAVF